MIVRRIKDLNSFDSNIEQLMRRDLKYFELLLKGSFQSQNIEMCTCHTAHVDNAVASIFPILCESIASINEALRECDRYISEDIYRQVERLMCLCGQHGPGKALSKICR